MQFERLIRGHASVNVCRLCTNTDKTVDLFSRAGMNNEWSSRISAVLDITISICVCALSPHVDCHHWKRLLSSGSWPYRH